MFLTAGLASARLSGLALDGAGSSYTLAALCFEIPTAAIAAWLLARAPLELAR